MLRWIPLLVFAIAFGIRLIGITWGLPTAQHHQSYHPDEEPIWRYAQQIQPTALDFTPGFYNYGTLYLTALKVGSDMAGVYGGKKSTPEAIANPQIEDWEWVRNCHLAGRMISAVSGALCGVFVFLILCGRTHWVGALLGSLLVALAPGLAVHSRFQTVDVLAAMLLFASAYASLRLMPVEPAPESSPPITKLVAISGVLAGLSAGTKYTGVLAVITLLAAIWMSQEKAARLRLGLIGIGSALAAFFVSTPGVLLESSAFARDFKYEMLHTSSGHGLVFEGMGSGFGVHLWNLAQGMGGFALVLAAVGVVCAAVRREKWIWALLAFGLVYYVLIGRAEVLFLRYTFPLYLVLACGFGWLMGLLHERGGAWRMGPVLGIVALGNTLTWTMLYSSSMKSEDPRDAVAAYLKKEATDETVVGLVSDPWYYTPSLFPDSAHSRMAVASADRALPGSVYTLMKMNETTRPKVVRYLPENARERIDWDIRLLEETKPDYVAFSSFEVGDVARLSKAGHLSGETEQLVGRYASFLAKLRADYDQILPVGQADPDFTQAYALPHDMAYVRPLIYLWKRK